MSELLDEVGSYIDDPAHGVAFCWVFAPLITLAIMQRIKCLAKDSGVLISAPCLEGLAFYFAWGVAMLIQVGLYSFDYRPSMIHSILIAAVYASIVNWWMGWAKKNKPDMYQAFRTDRRCGPLEDTNEIKGPPS